LLLLFILLGGVFVIIISIIKDNIYILYMKKKHD